MCAKDNCDKPAIGKSKYCDEHKVEARTAWLAMIATKGSEKDAREQKWLDLHNRAHAAGMAAGEAVSPVPMVVVQREHPLDDNSPIVKQYAPVMDGVCGFAWVKVTPGNSSFALWLKKTGRGRSAYQGGVQIWVGEFGQSMQRKEAFAVAYAEVVRAEGIKAYAGSRMD